MRTTLPVGYKLGDLFSSDDRLCKSYCIEKHDNSAIDKFIKDNFTEKRPLSYMGLAGASLTDVAHWGSDMKSGISVEICRNVYHEQIRSLVSRQKTIRKIRPEKLLVILDDIDDFLDPKNNNSIHNNSQVEEFLPLTLINLDYYGSIISTDKDGRMARVGMLQELFKLQSEKNPSFKYLMLLTVYHGGKDWIEGEESQMKSIMVEYRQMETKEIVDKVLNKDERIPLLAYAIPLFIAEAAKSSQTSIRILDRLTYRDSKYHMVHFIFELEAKKQHFPEIDHVGIFKDAPLIRIENKAGNVCSTPYFKA